MFMHVVWRILTVGLITRICDGQLTSPLISLTLHVGINSSATFVCQTNDTKPIRWNFKARSSNATVLLCSGCYMLEELASKYSVNYNTETRQSDLTVKNVGPGDVGNYSCLAYDHSEHAVKFELAINDAADVTNDSDIEALRTTNRVRGDTDNILMFAYCLLSSQTVSAIIIIYLIGKVRRRAQTGTQQNQDVTSSSSVESSAPTSVAASDGKTGAAETPALHAVNAVYAEVRKKPRTEVNGASCVYSEVVPKALRQPAPSDISVSAALPSNHNLRPINSALLYAELPDVEAGTNS